VQIVDTHCHIHEASAAEGEDFLRGIWQKAENPNPDAMISRAADVGVTRLLCVGTSAKDSKLAVDFVQSRDQCWASIGVHPHDAKDGLGALTAVAALAGRSKVVAVGECGLDYFYTHSPKEDQIKALQFQIELALQHDLPMIFHVREAFDDFWPVFDSYKGIRGVLHSYTDSSENLRKALERGLYIGANGIMTFSKNRDQLQMIQAVPLQKLLIETDAPFLTPVPFRGKVNEPAHAIHIAAFLADLRGESLQTLTNQTTENALTLFKLK
jgi:TatD DNase family protein